MIRPVEAMTRTDLEPHLTSVRAPAPDGAGFRSILFGAGDVDLADVREPDVFRDLNLDQVVGAIVGQDEYDLRPFFHAPLRDVDAITYRQEVFHDLETDAVRAAVHAFAEQARRVRQHLTLVETQHYRYETERWFLDAAEIYCDAVVALRDALNGLELGSRGLRSLSAFLVDYTRSEGFASLRADARLVLEGLARVRYTLRIRGGRVTVSRYEGEVDYGVEVEETFARFRRGVVDEHRLLLPDSGTMDHVEARIAERVARLFPEEFRALDEFCARHVGFLDARIARFEREIQFYLASLEYVEGLGKSGLAFCYPAVSTRAKEVDVEGGFDVALATALSGDRGALVANDVRLHGPERVLVVTGPNQGGKTTYARMVGQLHYQAALGLPVAARRARLFVPDRIFTHFEREEDISTLRGKLDDELLRVREILEHATGDSLIILNEIFASTTLADSLLLGTEVLDRLLALGCPAVCVTFVDELASLGEETVSMVATVAPDDPSERTFRIVRRPADGRAYALAIAAKYGLSYERLRSRVGR